MGENYEAPAFLVVALLLIAAATPTAYGQLRANILGINLDSTLVGRLSNGNCNAPTGAISNAMVSLNCTTGIGGASTTVGQNMTDLNGNFNINLNNIRTSLPSACGLSVVDNQPPILSGTVCMAVNGTLSSLNTIATRVGGVGSTISVPLSLSASSTTG